MSDFLPDLAARTGDRMAGGDPAGAILRDVCLAFERELPRSVVGVTVLDRSAHAFEHAIFPSLSDDYAAALRGILVADKPGSCALAVFDGRTVECTDVAFDGRFSAAWRELGLNHGLRALISIPARDRDGDSRGTLVVTHPPGAPLSGEQRALADAVAGLVAEVLRYRWTQAVPELSGSEQQQPHSGAAR